VPEATSYRIDLLGSRRAARLAALARLLTVAAALACCSAALLAPSPLRLAAALAASGAAAYALRPRRAAPAGQLAVAADGTILAGGEGARRAATVRYFGRHFVCLGTADGLLPLWPDAMSPAQWRRLQVACRWPRPQAADGGRPRSGSRTK
jgi:hypothetical protein